MAMLIDYFPDWIGNGIFQNLGSWVPWANDADVDPASLDLDYFGLRSGYRTPSPLVQKMAPAYPKQLDAVQIGRLVALIRSKFGYNWQKLWDAMQTQYSPLENYDMNESGDSGLRRDSKITTTGEDGIAALGTTSYTNIAKSVATTEGEAVYNNEIGAHTLHRHGNIGVTTSQQMLQSEIELRRTHYFDIIMSDVDSILTIPFWG